MIRFPMGRNSTNEDRQFICELAGINIESKKPGRAEKRMLAAVGERHDLVFVDGRKFSIQRKIELRGPVGRHVMRLKRLAELCRRLARKRRAGKTVNLLLRMLSYYRKELFGTDGGAEIALEDASLAALDAAGSIGKDEDAAGIRRRVEAVRESRGRLEHAVELLRRAEDELSGSLGPKRPNELREARKMAALPEWARREIREYRKMRDREVDRASVRQEA